MPDLPDGDSASSQAAFIESSRLADADRPQSTVLFGPFGLRAGWSILLFALGFALAAAALFFVLYHASSPLRESRDQARAERRATKSAPKAPATKPAPAKPEHVRLVFPVETTQAAALLLATFGMARLERRRFGVFGLGHFRLRHLLGGALTGLAVLSVFVGVLRALHLLVFDGQLLSGAAALRYGLGWLAVFAVVGLFEETFFRGYLQYTLMRGLFGLGEKLSPIHAQLAAFWMAALLWSVLFLVVHLGNSGETPTGLAAVFVAGMVFSYALWRTGSLWWGIGFHMAWDWAESFLFGVPDSGILSAGRLFSTHTAGNPLLSGGSAGPEGSLLVLPALLFVVVCCSLFAQVLSPRWNKRYSAR